MASPGIRTRYSIQQLSSDPALHGQLDKVIRAFAGIQALPPSNPNSFYSLSGFHGEPFRGPIASQHGSSSSDDEKKAAQKLWWGGYCNHGNVLFPTWHRAYMHRFEKALQSIEGCSDVMLPFWDECFEMSNWDPYSSHRGVALPIIPQIIPTILTDEYVTIGNERRKNPLFSYTLQRDTSYFVENEKNSRFSKPKGYETCRFPKRGIVSSAKECERSMTWNEQFVVPSDNSMVLNVNVAQWLEGAIQIETKPDQQPTPVPADTLSVYSRFRMCLEAPNYTVFSNTVSQNQWIKDMENKNNNERARIVSVESPHNSIHLAIGGFFNPGEYIANPKEYQEVKANGDMGDNETASFDPIFFFHHAFIDYAFWTWQKKHGLTRTGDLDVLVDYPGTITDEGSPVGIPPGTMLDMDIPLYPFRKENRKGWITSHEVTNINDLGYEYGKGSLDQYADTDTNFDTITSFGQNGPIIDSNIVSFKRVHGINRAEIEGSFVIRTIAKRGTKSIEIGREAILSRLNVRGCANCQTHLEAESLVPVYRSVVTALGADSEKEIEYEVQIDTHDAAWRVPLGAPLSEAQVLPVDSLSDGAFKNAKSIVRIESMGAAIPDEHRGQDVQTLHSASWDPASFPCPNAAGKHTSSSGQGEGKLTRMRERDRSLYPRL